jgi:DNA repair exonuclease SbcCD nuclease subunit
MEIKYTFLLTCDTHLNRMYPDKVDVQRIKAHNSAFAQIVNYAIKHKVNGILHAGDLFDMPKPWATVVEFVKKQLFKMSKYGINLYCVKGNHDGGSDKEFLKRGSAIEYAKLPNIPNLCYLDPLLDMEMKKDTIGYAQYDDVIGIWGVGYYGKNTEKLLNSVLHKGAITDKFSILLLHFFVKGISDMGFENELVIPHHEIAKYPLNLVVLGHNHKKVDPIVKNNVTFVTPGSPEMWDFFKPYGLGFYVLNINDDFTFNLEWIAIDPLYHMENIVIQSKTPQNADWYAQTLENEIKKRISNTDKQLILNVQLKGKLLKDSAFLNVTDLQSRLIGMKEVIYLRIDDRINLDLDTIDVKKFKSRISDNEVYEILSQYLENDDEIEVYLKYYDKITKELDNEAAVTKTGNLKSKSYEELKDALREDLLVIEYNKTTVNHNKKSSKIKKIKQNKIMDD